MMWPLRGSLYVICILLDMRRSSGTDATVRKLSDVISAENATRKESEYGEFKVIQSNVVRITSPTYKLQRSHHNLFKRQVDGMNATTVQVPLLLSAAPPDKPPTTSTSATVWVDAKHTDITSSQEQGASQQGKHGDKQKKKKKKKKHGLFGMMSHKMKKWLPKFMSKMHGPSMFMMGMAQANFQNFIMQALWMSKMALISVVMMIIRESVFGDKDEPVKYYNFGYEHPPPKKHYYEPPPPPPHHHSDGHPSDDYQYDYKRRRKRNVRYRR